MVILKPLYNLYYRQVTLITNYVNNTHLNLLVTRYDIFLLYALQFSALQNLVGCFLLKIRFCKNHLFLGAAVTMDLAAKSTIQVCGALHNGGVAYLAKSLGGGKILDRG